LVTVPVSCHECGRCCDCNSSKLPYRTPWTVPSMNPSSDPMVPISLHWVDSSGNPAIQKGLVDPPPDKILCANIDPDVFKTCGKNGVLVCSACRLVSYCSSVSTTALSPVNISLRTTQGCQKKHWKKHKIGEYGNNGLYRYIMIRLTDCSSPMRSAEWKPSYIEETRRPAWIKHETLRDEAHWRERTEFGFGMALWVL